MNCTKNGAFVCSFLWPGISSFWCTIDFGFSSVKGPKIYTHTKHWVKLCDLLVVTAATVNIVLWDDTL